MKYLTILIFLLQSSLCQAASNTEIRINTDEGYPYKNLIKKTKKVELRYVENNEEIKCRVNVYTSDNSFNGKEQTVSIKKFQKRPMASCLTRVKAKEILSLL